MSEPPRSGGVTLVTGGSGGIGRAVVAALVERGEAVAFTYRGGEAAARELEEASGGAARAYPLDLADRRRPAELLAEIEEVQGPVAALVNNAGFEKSGLLALTSDADWDAVLDVNLGGAFRCCRAVVKGMVTRRRGAIVNVSSLGALRGVAGQSAYAASKAGLLALTRCLAREVGKRGVRVNAVVPGYVVTGMTASLPEAVVSRLRAAEALPSGAAPEAVAQAIVYLLSDAAAGITGQVLNVDAGASA